jgi:hypothetical protein
MLNLVLRRQPHLRLVNINNVSSRLLARTSGTCFIAYNTFNGCYELHSTESLDENNNTCNAVIDKSWLNGRIITDFLANNHKRFGQEVQDSRVEMQHLYERNDEERKYRKTGEQIEIIKRTLGRRT